jgi:hypothetical protein
MAPLAHGGTGGLIVELLLIAVLLALGAAVWWRTRGGDIDEAE